MPYAIPPWIQPADTARNYLAGLQLGANIAQANQRLQAQREEAAMEAEIRTRQLEEQSQERRQRIMLDTSYKEQMLGLQERQLQETQKKNQFAVETAARKFAAQQAFRARVQSGEDPAKVMLEMGPLMGASSGDFSAALRQTSARPAGPVEAFPVTYEGKAVPGLLGVQTAGGGMRTVGIPGFKPEGTTSADRNMAASYLKSQRSELVKSLPPKPRAAENLPKWEAETAPVRQEIADLDRKIRGLLPALGEAAPALSVGGNTVRRVGRDPKTGRFKLLPPVPQDQLKSHDEE